MYEFPKRQMTLRMATGIGPFRWDLLSQEGVLLG